MKKQKSVQKKVFRQGARRSRKDSQDNPFSDVLAEHAWETSGKDQIIRLGKKEYRRKYSESLPPYDRDKFRELVESISYWGVKVPVLMDNAGNLIDGWYRLCAAKILGLNEIPTITVCDLSAEDKQNLSDHLHCHRRHLTPKQVQELAKKSRMLVPLLATKMREEGKSLRDIADALGVSHTLVANAIQKIEQSATRVTLPKVTLGRDGKRYLSKAKPRKDTIVHTMTVRETERALTELESVQNEPLPKRHMNLYKLEKTTKKITRELSGRGEPTDFGKGNVRLYHGGFQEVARNIPDNSVQVICTDLLYGKDFLHLFGELASFAKQKLKPGGLLLTYSGQLFKYDIYVMLAKYLEYVWEIAVEHTGGHKPVESVQFFQYWKPVMLWCKPPRDIYWNCIPDMISGNRAKENHDYEQPVSESLALINAFCSSRQTIVDPCMGSGTVIEAALRSGLELNCIGIEIDPSTYVQAQRRIDKVCNELQLSEKSA